MAGTEQAYADAPDTHTEVQALITLGLSEARAGRRPDRSREWVLRQAAHADRAALDVEAGSLADGLYPGDQDASFLAQDVLCGAGEAALELLRLDREHGAAGAASHSPEWDGERGARAYVRIQYAVWRRRQLARLDAEVPRLTTEMTAVADLATVHAHAARRSAPYPPEDVLDLARRRVRAYQAGIDLGLPDLVTDLHHAQKELDELHYPHLRP
ncbi:hypothetical protein [Kitasatospora indigofera]|nr:hypothetical protein [Kitasatospora indigofera]